MLHRSRTRLVAALTASLLLLSAGAGAGATHAWRSLARGSVTVFFHEDDRAAAERVLDVAGPAAARLRSAVGAATQPSFRMFVAATNEEFDRLGGGVPDWGVGWADASRGLVALRSPRLVEYPLRMETVVVHEVAHLVVGSALEGTEAPRWFHEGVAMGLAGEWDGGEAALGAAAVTGTLIPLSSIERSFPEDARAAALAYAESFRAVRFLTRRSGLVGEADLVGAVARAADFRSAVRTLTGESVSQFDVDFRAHLRRTFGWTAALRGAGALMLVGAAALGAATLRRKRRARRRLLDLEAEDDRAARRAGHAGGRTGSSWN
jgi:hypothetical protein